MKRARTTTVEAPCLTFPVTGRTPAGAGREGFLSGPSPQGDPLLLRAGRRVSHRGPSKDLSELGDASPALRPRGTEPCTSVRTPGLQNKGDPKAGFNRNEGRPHIHLGSPNLALVANELRRSAPERRRDPKTTIVWVKAENGRSRLSEISPGKVK